MCNVAKPFLKWVGGKSQLVPELLKRIPLTWDYQKDLYIEPFLGGGALFFALQPENAIINDANAQLINTYLAVHIEVDRVIEILITMQELYRANPEQTYYDIREDGESEDSTWNAARFIFINKAGFNGLYRVNKSGACNTPWGRNPDVVICNEERLRQCSTILDKQNVKWACQDFASILVDHAIENALVYIDPPYLPASSTSNFTGYTSGGFSYSDQIQLLNAAIGMRERGAHLIISLGSGPLGDQLVQNYKNCGFKVHPIQARRAINSDAKKRGNVGEYIITS